MENAPGFSASREWNKVPVDINLASTTETFRSEFKRIYTRSDTIDSS